MTCWKLMQYKTVKPVKQFGFTLIELMVVVAVIAILASIAFPSYQNYVLRAGRTDAKDALLNIAQQLERHYTQNNSYSTFTLTEQQKKSPAGLYNIAFEELTATTYEIKASATGKQSEDKECTYFSINHSGTKKPTDSSCW